MRPTAKKGLHTYLRLLQENLIFSILQQNLLRTDENFLKIIISGAAPPKFFRDIFPTRLAVAQKYQASAHNAGAYVVCMRRGFTIKLFFSIYSLHSLSYWKCAALVEVITQYANTACGRKNACFM